MQDESRTKSFLDFSPLTGESDVHARPFVLITRTFPGYAEIFKKHCPFCADSGLREFDGIPCKNIQVFCSFFMHSLPFCGKICQSGAFFSQSLPACTEKTRPEGIPSGRVKQYSLRTQAAWPPHRRTGDTGRFRQPGCCASSSGGTWCRQPR